MRKTGLMSKHILLSAMRCTK